MKLTNIIPDDSYDDWGHLSTHYQFIISYFLKPHSATHVLFNKYLYGKQAKF